MYVSVLSFFYNSFSLNLVLHEHLDVETGPRGVEWQEWTGTVITASVTGTAVWQNSSWARAWSHLKTTPLPPRLNFSAWRTLGRRPSARRADPQRRRAPHWAAERPRLPLQPAPAPWSPCLSSCSLCPQSRAQSSVPPHRTQFILM